MEKLVIEGGKQLFGDNKNTVTKLHNLSLFTLGKGTKYFPIYAISASDQSNIT